MIVGMRKIPRGVYARCYRICLCLERGVKDIGGVKGKLCCSGFLSRVLTNAQMQRTRPIAALIEINVRLIRAKQCGL